MTRRTLVLELDVLWCLPTSSFSCSSEVFFSCCNCSNLTDVTTGRMGCLPFCSIYTSFFFFMSVCSIPSLPNLHFLIFSLTFFGLFISIYLRPFCYGNIIFYFCTLFREHSWGIKQGLDICGLSSISDMAACLDITASSLPTIILFIVPA